ncbi:MAG: thioredoxin [Candidatus Blackburnbacteria bacterium]|nr:thioredoxin [Candidatus Blackburnbacteria bacterium]
MAVLAIDDNNFDKEVLESKVPVLVDYAAEWCGPCRLAGPVLDELAKEYEGKVKIVKIDVDQSPKTPANFGVMSIPTTILFKNGKEIGRQVGFGGKKPFEELINKGL